MQNVYKLKVVGEVQSAKCKVQSEGVRVSGGHLCEAEALSEPEGEYLRRNCKR